MQIIDGPSGMNLEMVREGVPDGNLLIGGEIKPAGWLKK
jgi:hypothetical protein